MLKAIIRVRGHILTEVGMLVLDAAGGIISEYERTLDPDSLGRRFYVSCIRAGRCHYAPNRANKRCGDGLERLGFDPSDRKFVAVAQHTGGLYVTTEEKHLLSERRAEVMHQCGVRIVTLLEAATIIDAG